MTFDELHRHLDASRWLPLSSSGQTACEQQNDVIHEMLCRIERIEYALGLPEWPLVKAAEPEP